MRTVTKVMPTIIPMPRPKRVAAYARVSSGKDAMLHSLSAQISYYSAYIQQHRGWVYAGVYPDEARTGTKDDRPELQRLLADCRAGKVDMIVTKSIARFARNTVTMLEIVRKLKELGIDVYFENNNIHSISEDGELMLTVLASFAQEESRSVSENCKWRIRSRFAKGELVNLRFEYGFRISRSQMEIDPEQAAMVRMMHEDYLAGIGGDRIAKRLRAIGAPTPRGGEWTGNRVRAILKNEKNVGNALLQKKFVADHLSKKLVRNKGELAQYYAEGTHPAIVTPELYERVQAVMAERGRKFKARDNSGNRYPFTSKIICGLCGKHYKRKTAHGNAFWQCSAYLREGTSACRAKQVPEDTLMTMAAEALGLGAFDKAIFADRIAKIRVPENNRLVFVFHDGQTVGKIWKDRSRAESWGPEQRQAAREHALKRRRPS